MNDAPQTPVHTSFEPAFSQAAAPGNTFVLPEHKMLYVSVAKVEGATVPAQPGGARHDLPRQRLAGLLRGARPVVANVVGLAVELLGAGYQEDFDEFGERWSLQRTRHKAADSWSSDAIEHTVYHTVANERIGGMSRTTKRLARMVRP